MIRPASLLLASLLCACTSTPATPAAGSSPPPRAVLRTLAQTAIDASVAIEGTSALAALTQALLPTRTLGKPNFPPPGCRSGTDTAWSYTPDGAMATIDVYYDSGCTQRLTHASVVSVRFIPTIFQVSGDLTLYERDGTVSSKGTFVSQSSLSPSDDHWDTKVTFTKRNGRTIEALTMKCTLAKHAQCAIFGGTTLYGFAQGPGKAAGTVRASAGRSGSFEEIFAGGAIGGQLLLTDASTGFTAHAFFGSRFGLSASTVQRGRTTEATFETDACGTGSIAYADGSREPIRFFTIADS